MFDILVYAGGQWVAECFLVTKMGGGVSVRGHSTLVYVTATVNRGKQLPRKLTSRLEE